MNILYEHSTWRKIIVQYPNKLMFHFNDQNMSTLFHFCQLCLTAILLRRPFASATREHNVSQHEHRKRYGTLALRNARQALVAFSARHSSWTKHRSRILFYCFDLQSCLCKYKRLECRVCGKALGDICCQICQKLNYITPLKTAKMPPITLVNAWPSWIDTRLNTSL